MSLPISRRCYLRWKIIAMWNPQRLRQKQVTKEWGTAMLRFNHFKTSGAASPRLQLNFQPTTNRRGSEDVPRKTVKKTAYNLLHWSLKRPHAPPELPLEQLQQHNAAVDARSRFRRSQ